MFNQRNPFGDRGNRDPITKCMYYTALECTCYHCKCNFIKTEAYLCTAYDVKKK